MNSASLICIAGPLRSHVFSISLAEFSVGRDGSNQLAMNDPLLSRRHCRVINRNGSFFICDNDSLNGTFVNGLPVKERELHDGDRISLGDSMFLFSGKEEPAEAGTKTTIQFHSDEVETRSVIKLQRQEAYFYNSGPYFENFPRSERIHRYLGPFLAFSTSLSGLKTLEALAFQTIKTLSSIFVVDHVAFVTVRGEAFEFDQVTAVDTHSPTATVHVNKALIRQVLHDGQAFLSNEIVFPPEHAVETGNLLAIHSIVCIPVVLHERTLGALYFDSTTPSVQFDREDLQIATAVAGIIAPALETVRNYESLTAEAERLQLDVARTYSMVGESPRMKEVYHFIGKVAPSQATVLVLGESGTGKEVVARAIHAASPRAKRPFVAVNCAVLTEHLLESELFGHEKGAFTGAIAQKKGKFEIADGGTIFLDEIGEIPLSLQAKLLRVLQEREIERIGGTRPQKVDLRIIAATNQNLEEGVKNGSFRQDLFYRLNVISITLPPLRDRRDDIPLLARYFVAKFSREANRKVSSVAPETLTLLTAYDWPGNIRELENAIERAVVLGASSLVLPEDLPETVLEAASPSGLSITNYHEAVLELKRRLIFQAVKNAGENYTEAAKALGLHPNYLHRLIRNLQLKEALRL
ncbi:MAG: sigma 54-interacting transcriptional regulator [Blastocatellia bacterium]|nr:sigma 54-interacting transcriptional regulator [Blastocatellia bacterium]